MADSPPDITVESIASAPSSDAKALWEDFAPHCGRSWRGACPPVLTPTTCCRTFSCAWSAASIPCVARIGPKPGCFRLPGMLLRDSLRARQRRDGRTDPLEVDLPAESDAEADRAAEAELAPCLTG